MKIEFWLPLPPARANRRGRYIDHWRKDSQWERDAALVMRSQGILWPREPWPRMRISCVFYLTAAQADREDPDNAVFRRKPILDLLKEHWVAPAKKTGILRRLSVPPAAENKRAVLAKRGFIRDDSRRYVVLGSEAIKVTDGQPRVFLTLERLEAAEEDAP